MKLNLAILLSVLLAIAFLGTVGAFLIYVPALSVFSAATIVLGLGLMFAFGLHTGRRWRKQSPFTPRPAEIRKPYWPVSAVR